LCVKLKYDRIALIWTILLAGPALCGETAGRGDGVPQASLLQRLREARLDTQTVAVRFTQTKELALLDVTLTSQGWIFYERPDSVRYEILSPIRSLLMYDGKKVRNFAHSEGAWRRLRSPAADAVGRVMRQIGHWLQGDFTSDGSVFHVTTEAAEDAAGLIVLTPKTDALREFIQRIELTVMCDPDCRVTRVVIRESAEDVTQLLFREETLDAEFPVGTFRQAEVSAACAAVFPEVPGQAAQEGSGS
jgi:outer membrane lipoprotein-sorting protein